MPTKITFEQKLLILAIIFLPINHFRIELPFVRGNLSNLFLLIGIVWFIYKLFIGKECLKKIERFSLYYLLVFLIWQCICTVIGIQEYDYYSLLYLEQMDRLRHLLQTFRNIGLNISDVAAIKVWLGIRFVKDCILDILFSYGISIWICAIYKHTLSNHKKENIVFSHITFAVGVLCLALISYSVIEIGYLRGSQMCSELLTIINPWLYEVKKLHGWWPPMLWKNQLRSLFAEPSFFGLGSTLIVPILFYKILTTEKRLFTFVYGIFLTMLFMTKARTAILLFIGQSILLLIYVFTFKRIYIKKILKISIITMLAFVASLYLITGFRDVASVPKVTTSFEFSTTAASFVDNNVTSVVGDKRSNSARLASVRATFLTGLQHPFWGVGKGLSNAYIKDNFTDMDLANKEVRNWVSYLHENGVLKFPIPILNQLSIEIAQFGFPGLIMYLLPAFYIFSRIAGHLKKDLDAGLCCILIAYIGSIAAMFSNTAFITYYILTGLLIVLLHNDEEGVDADLKSL